MGSAEAEAEGALMERLEKRRGEEMEREKKPSAMCTPHIHACVCDVCLLSWRVTFFSCCCCLLFCVLRVARLMRLRYLPIRMRVCVESYQASNDVAANDDDEWDGAVAYEWIGSAEAERSLEQPKKQADQEFAKAPTNKQQHTQTRIKSNENIDN